MSYKLITAVCRSVTEMAVKLLTKLIKNDDHSDNHDSDMDNNNITYYKNYYLFIINMIMSM